MSHSRALQARAVASTGDASALRGAEVGNLLVVFEPTPNGRAALRAGTDLSGEDGRLTVVALAPQSLPSRCCGPSVEVVNCAVRDAAERDLKEARDLVGSAADRMSFRCLVGRRDPPLAEWAAGERFDLILLPAHRLTPGGHPAVRRLRRVAQAEIRLIRNP